MSYKRFGTTSKFISRRFGRIERKNKRKERNARRSLQFKVTRYKIVTSQCYTLLRACFYHVQACTFRLTNEIEQQGKDSIQYNSISYKYFLQSYDMYKTDNKKT